MFWGLYLSVKIQKGLRYNLQVVWNLLTLNNLRFGVNEANQLLIFWKRGDYENKYGKYLSSWIKKIKKSMSQKKV